MEVRTQEEYDRAQSLWREVRPYSIWLGGSDREVEGEWRWESDDEPINMTQVWRSGQPNRNGNCLRIQSGGLYDGSCSATRNFVCSIGYEPFVFQVTCVQYSVLLSLLKDSFKT